MAVQTRLSAAGDGRSTSWVKVKNVTYTRADGRAEFFEKTPRARRQRPPELKLV